MPLGIMHETQYLHYLLHAVFQRYVSRHARQKTISQYGLEDNMPLDKMDDPEEFVPTHKSVVLHSSGWPVACIIDKDRGSASDLLSIHNDRKNLKASLVGFLNRHDDAVLLMGFKLKIQNNDRFFEYTVYPSDEFIDAVILGESICIINEKMESLFLLDKIVTDQFVKTKSEFEKFKKAMRQQ